MPVAAEASCRPCPEIVASRPVRGLLIAAGTLCVALGLLGILLPLLPTTPLLLAAAACYARSSPRLRRWLLENRLFGRYLRAYAEGKRLSMRSTVLILVLLWMPVGFSVWRIVPAELWWARGLLLAVALAVTVHIVRKRI
ncbi:MAG: DUF454 family protein [Armatimonadota bacterium]